MRRFGLGCGGLVAVLLLAGCSSGGTHAAAPSPTTASPTPSRTPSPTPTPKPKPRPKPPAVNPLTGLRGVPKQRVVVVKIDDTANGRPQIGLESADLVYVEQVEAGLTRLAAVFASRHPTVVGPVRSVRKSDPELLGTYGRPALAYSGGAAGPVAVLRRSPVLDAGPQRAGAAYRRLSSRGAPYNLVVDTSRVAAAAVGASSVRDIGLRWSTADPALAAARRVGTVSVTVGRTVLRFRWSGPARAWLELNADGSYRRTASGRPIATPNLVVPFSPAHIDRSDVDVVGNPSVFTSTIGSGRVLVFRDGRVLGGRWRRSRLGGPTAYLDAAGKPIPLHPGGAWVLLAATGAPVDMR